ncbi:hypothetical protein AKJ16_DCAP00496 [Drosera capensis]
MMFDSSGFVGITTTNPSKDTTRGLLLRGWGLLYNRYFPPNSASVDSGLLVSFGSSALGTDVCPPGPSK